MCSVQFAGSPASTTAAAAATGAGAGAGAGALISAGFSQELSPVTVL